MTLLNIYGIADAAPATQVRGAMGEPVRSLPCGPLFLLAGELESAPPLSADCLRAHDAAVRRLAQACPALLPVRFGSAVPSVDVSDRIAELSEALEIVRGREQMTLRVYAEAREPERTSGTAYLESLRRARAVPEIAPLRAALAPLIRAERTEPHGQSLVASVYHLIDRGRAAEYLRKVAEVPLEVRVSASGPWPAWSFAPEAVR
ncbi:MAG TPA: GvpL/GvpF family gas vesicle protein [Myxococcales bacterium]|nr:GvpL/GvpF family gas vesicle protein [Myxococcales bacterium]